MNPTLRALAADLARLANDQGLPAVACLAHRVAEGPRVPANALLALLDADASQLADWIEATVLGTALKTVREQGEQTDLALWLADKIVIAFPCGGLPTSDTLATLANGPLQRQPHSAAVALIGAEEIETADDLALVESTARRWLLPVDAAGNPPADVQAAGAYLWAQRTDANSAFAPRLARDRDALARWLQTPLSPQARTQLDRGRLAFALSLLEAERYEQSEGGSSERIDRRAVYRLQDDLADLKGRLLSRLRSESEQLETAAQQAVEELDRLLSDGLSAAVAALPLPRHRPEAAIRQSIGHYCDDRVRAWLGEQQRTADQWRKALAGMRELLAEQDWASFASVTGRNDYPERLLAALSEAEGSDEMPGSESGSDGDAAVPLASPHPLRWSLVTLGPGMLGAAAAALSGYGLVGMAVVGAATSTAAAGYQWHSSRGDVRAGAEAYGRQVIGDLVARIRRQMPDSVANLADTLRLQLVAEFERLQELLDDLLRSGAPSSDTETGDPLRDIRNQLSRLLAQEAADGL